MIWLFNKAFSDLEPPAIEAVLDVVRTDSDNRIFRALVPILEECLAGEVQPNKPRVLDWRLGVLTDVELAQVIAVFSAFAKEFVPLAFVNAARFCAWIHELALAEQLNRINFPGRLRPEFN